MWHSRGSCNTLPPFPREKKRVRRAQPSRVVPIPNFTSIFRTLPHARASRTNRWKRWNWSEREEREKGVQKRKRLYLNFRNTPQLPKVIPLSSTKITRIVIHRICDRSRALEDLCCRESLFMEWLHVCCMCCYVFCVSEDVFVILFRVGRSMSKESEYIAMGKNTIMISLEILKKEG